MPLVVELGPAEHGREGEEEQHRVQQDKPADSGIGVLDKDHERHEPDSRPLEVQLLAL